MPVKKETNDKRWPGYVMMPDYFSFPNLLRWEQAMAKAKEAKDSNITSEFYLQVLPTAISFVQEWHIDGLPEKVDENNFPASSGLMSWMIGVVTDLYVRTNDPSPNLQGQP